MLTPVQRSAGRQGQAYAPRFRLPRSFVRLTGALAVATSPAAAQPSATSQPRPAATAPATEQTPDAIPHALLGWNAAPLDEPLVTDRPDFTESTETVPWGHFQLESGYTFTYDREHRDRVRDHTFPEFLLRAGIVQDFELRLGWDGHSATEVNYEGETRGGRAVDREEWDDGFADLDLGFKLKFVEQRDWIPNLAFLAGMNVPTGSATVSPRDVEPSAALLWSYDLPDPFALAGQFILAAPTEEGDRFVQTAASLSLAIALTDRVGAYVEYFGFYPNADDSDAAHSMDGGLTFLVSNDFQIDLRAGFGLNEEADDFFAGVGFAWRL